MARCLLKTRVNDPILLSFSLSPSLSLSLVCARALNAPFARGKEWRRMPVIFYGNSIKFLELKEQKASGRFFFFFFFFRCFTTTGDGLLFLMAESVTRRNRRINRGWREIEHSFHKSAFIEWTPRMPRSCRERSHFRVRVLFISFVFLFLNDGKKN